MKLEVLGMGCAKCNALEAAVRRIADELGLEYELEHVSDLERITDYGVLMTPGLVVDGQVKFSGKVPNDTKLKAILSAG